MDCVSAKQEKELRKQRASMKYYFILKFKPQTHRTYAPDLFYADDMDIGNILSNKLRYSWTDEKYDFRRMFSLGHISMTRHNRVLYLHGWRRSRKSCEQLEARIVHLAASIGIYPVSHPREASDE